MSNFQKNLAFPLFTFFFSFFLCSFLHFLDPFDVWSCRHFLGFFHSSTPCS
jgi:hypothetical protein